MALLNGICDKCIPDQLARPRNQVFFNMCNDYVIVRPAHQCDLARLYVFQIREFGSGLGNYFRCLANISITSTLSHFINGLNI